MTWTWVVVVGEVLTIGFLIFREIYRPNEGDQDG